jgi:hypothetical protein
MVSAVTRLGLIVVAAAVLASAATAGAHPARQGLPLAIGEVPERTAPTAKAAQEPPLTPVPRPDCAPGDNPETDIQGRVPAGSTNGFTCNTTLVGRHGSSGGYKALRFTDRTGRECAYYDTTLLFPTNVQTLSERPTGVAVLDMSDPAKPVQTAFLATPAMQTPHESLVLNERRGLLVAVMGNPTFYPGVVDVYDLNADCRNPALQSSLPVGLLGHESGFAPDGNTFYATSIGTGHITAVDITNPKLPRTLAVGRYRSHGLMVSDDGNRAYVAASEGLIILDTSDIQARRPNPQFREISRLDWPTRTIPQVATPVTIGGKPFLVEIDEFSSSGDGSGTSVTSNGPRVGAARIIDISDEKAPRVVSNIRLAVHQPENRPQLINDPGASSPLQGYAGHYCNVPRRNEPGIVACSMIASGLRIFDIRDPYAPKEIAYFVAPNTRSNTAGPPSNYAMSSPSFAPERNEVWYTDGNSGFYNVRLTNWPGQSAPAAGVAAGDCTGDAGFRSVSARPQGRRVRLSFTRRLDLPVRIDVFRVSQGRRIVKERRVARFRRAATWSGRGPDGYFFVRFTMLRDGKRVDVRRIVLRRENGRFERAGRHHRRGDCELLRSFKLERPVFGGRARTPLRIAYRLTTSARVSIVVLRGKRVVRRFAAESAAGRTYRIRLNPKQRGVYRVRIAAVSETQRATATLTARRL